MSDIKIMAKGLGFPEGPVVYADGTVILTEIKGRAVSRVDRDGTVTRLGNPGGGPNGIAVGPDGFLYVCDNGGGYYPPDGFMATRAADDYRQGYVLRVDPKTGERKVLYAECNGRKLCAPNDIVFDKQGGFYFTDLGKRFDRYRDHGGLYYAQPDGSTITEIAHPILSANGVGLSPDEKTVYVADTEPARLWAFDIESPGVLRKEGFPSPNGGRCIAGLGGYQRFDSLAVQANGDIAVATLVTGKIAVISPNGAIVREVAMPDTHPTNICFGGTDMRTAYITLSGNGELGVMQWHEPGLKLNYQR